MDRPSLFLCPHQLIFTDRQSLKLRAAQAISAKQAPDRLGHSAPASAAARNPGSTVKSEATQEEQPPSETSSPRSPHDHLSLMQFQAQRGKYHRSFDLKVKKFFLTLILPANLLPLITGLSWLQEWIRKEPTLCVWRPLCSQPLAVFSA